jgi:hypothetical protein
LEDLLALYELKDATLGGVDGQGYAFVVETFRGKEYKGVFFASEKEPLEALEGADAVEFAGIVYHKTTSGNDTLNVDITKVLSVGVGARADFSVVE